jgi:hypothetical protein
VHALLQLRLAMHSCNLQPACILLCAAAKAYKELGLAGIARIDGWLHMDPHWQQAYSVAAEDCAPLPDLEDPGTCFAVALQLLVPLLCCASCPLLHAGGLRSCWSGSTYAPAAALPPSQSGDLLVCLCSPASGRIREGGS